MDIVALIGGLLLILVGANALTDGAASVAKRFNISSLVIGLTIVAFGTSAPELTVSIVSALKGSADVFLYPGHVNAITGTRLCEALTEEGVSGVVAGFTAKELMTALAVALVKFQEGKPFFVNCYPRVVKPEGSREAQQLTEEMTEACDSEWRGLGVIPKSGVCLKKEWSAFDARKKYNIPSIQGKANPACRCGDVLQGKCKVFGKVCTPQHPVGACMVSNEGACSAYYAYGDNQ